MMRPQTRAKTISVIQRRLQGKSLAEIAEEDNVSIRVCETNLYSLRMELGAKDSLHLVGLLYLRGELLMNTTRVAHSSEKVEWVLLRNDAHEMIKNINNRIQTLLNNETV